jgi:Alr-MurF fusion protein
MERVVKGLLAADAAAQSLVRQEPAWATVRAADPGRATWVETDLDAIAANTRQLKLLAGDAELMAVLKADAYGHGALRVARTALANGASQLAVATLGEAQVLRAGGVAAPILVLGYTPPTLAHELVALELDATVFDRDCAHALGAAAGALGRQARVQLKIDTGMARLGVMAGEAVALMQQLVAMPNLRFTGTYTHLSSADEPDATWSLLQLARFEDVLRALAQAGLPTPTPHALNSAGLLRFRQARYAMVRPGIALYGLAPSSDTPLPAGFRPALCWKTRLARVAELPPETPVGYGRAYITPDLRRIGTIPVGYADGFRRAPHWREVLLGGRRVPLVGRVCMDYAMLDITAVPEARVGDEVVLLGSQGADTISADEVAGWLGTSNYEVVAAIMPRVPRTGR